MHDTNATVIVLSIALAIMTGCQSKTASRPVAVETQAPTIGSPQWIDVSTAVPVAIAIRPDGRQVIAQAGPVTHAFEIPSGKQLHSWPQQVWASYSGDGNTVLTVSNSVTSVSDARSFRMLQSFPSPSPHNRNDLPPFSAAISHDGSRIALTDLSQASQHPSPHVIRVFECSSGTEALSILVAENTRVHSLEFLSDATRLLVQYSGPGDPRKHGTRHLWDIQRSKVIADFPETAKVIVSKNGDHIAVGKTGQETKITIHDAETGKLQKTFHQADVLSDFMFRPDSQQLLMASAIPRSTQNATAQSGSTTAKTPIARIRQWNIATSKITFEQTHDEFPFAAAMYDAAGDRIFGVLAKPTGLDDDVDYFLSGWNAKTSASSKTLPQAFFTYEYGQTFFVPDSDDTIALEKPLSIRNLKTGAERSPFAPYRIAQTHVQFKANKHAIYSGSTLIDLQTGVSSSSSPVGPRSQFIQDNRTLFRFRHPSVSLVDNASGEQFWNLYLTCAWYAARDNRITRDARSIVRSQPTTDDSINHARIMVIRTAEPNSPTILHRYASSVAIHPSDRRFAAASDQSIEEFDIPTGELIGKVSDVPGRVLDMAYLADGSHIVACGVIDHRDPQARFGNSSLGWVWLYDRKRHQIRKLLGHTAVVTSIAIDAPRNRLATSSNDGTVRLWDTKTAECLWVYRGHHSEIHRVDISSDGKLLASAGIDGIAVWNIAGVVDPDIAPVQVATNLTFAKDKRQKKRLTSSQTTSSTPPSPAQDQSSWDVVKVGKTDNVHFHNASVDLWLQENSKAHEISKINEIPPRTSRVPSAISGPSSKSRDGKRLLFTDFRKPLVKVFSSDYEEMQSWPIRADKQTAVISPDGNLVFIENKPDSDRSGKLHVDIYDGQSGELLNTIQDIDAEWGTAIKVDPLGRTLLIQIENNSIDLREIATGQSLGTLRSTPAGAGRNSRYSPDGRLIAMGKYPDTRILLCDPLTLKPIQTITNDLPVRWFKFTPDGTRLLVGQPYAESRTLLTMWEIDHTDMTNVRRLWSHAGPAGDKGLFSDDGSRYLSPANWNMWTLWDTEQGHVDVAIITSVSNSKDQFALSTDGQSIHFYTSDGALVWRKP